MKNVRGGRIENVAVKAVVSLMNEINGVEWFVILGENEKEKGLMELC